MKLESISQLIHHINGSFEMMFSKYILDNHSILCKKFNSEYKKLSIIY